MSVMRATSENRMQQHRRHRQNAGQRLKHEVFTALQTHSHAVKESLRQFFSSARTELSLECESGQSESLSHMPRKHRRRSRTSRSGAESRAVSLAFSSIDRRFRPSRRSH
jgi:hypothetical protein